MDIHQRTLSVLRRSITTLTVVFALAFGLVGIPTTHASAATTPALDGLRGAECPVWGVLHDGINVVDDVASMVGESPDLYGFFQGWGGRASFDTTRADAALQRGAVPVVAWEPFDWTKQTADQPDFRLSRIADGAHDDYIRSYARQVADWGRPVIIRFAHEMNGDWYPWAESVNGNRPGEYAEAWRHVHGIFAEEGADNAEWMWAPNVVYDGSTPLRGLYPGHDYVDWFGPSGYNWGATRPSGWQSFTQVFAETATQLRGIGDHPIIIAEMGSAEEGGDKAAWIRGMFEAIGTTVDVDGFMWFNYDKETDWRVQSSSSAQTAFADGIAGLADCRDATEAPAEDPTDDPIISRVSGENRVGTAVALSKQTYPNGTDTVVIAREDAYPDALAGAPLAHALDAPILLTSRTSLEPPVAAEIARLGATSAVILGGEAALTAEVHRSLDERGLDVERIAGDDRFQTAAQIGERVVEATGATHAYLVEGANADPRRGWPDAVAVAGLAAHEGRPILLTTSTSLPDPTGTALRALGMADVTIVGGTGAVGAVIETLLAVTGVTVHDRLAGANRWETSRAVADAAHAAGAEPARTWFASGHDFPDALAAGPAAAADGGILLLVDGRDLNGSEPARTWLQTHNGSITDLNLVGGRAVISSEVWNQAAELLR